MSGVSVLGAATTYVGTDMMLSLIFLTSTTRLQTGSPSHTGDAQCSYHSICSVILVGVKLAPRAFSKLVSWAETRDCAYMWVALRSMWHDEFKSPPSVPAQLSRC